MDHFRRLSTCLACGSRNLSVYLDLGTQPLANSFHDGTEKLEEYPLATQVCGECYHSQLTVAVEPDRLYKNYLYVSGTTKTLSDYFVWFAGWVDETFAGKKLNVLDIASNDGSLLTKFLANGHSVQGVDPAENLAALSAANNVPTRVAYWNSETAASLGAKYDAIVAMNVLGHIPEPHLFLEACASVLEKDGRLYIQTSQSDIFKNFEFDTIYHEHHSFFTMRSFQAIAARAGLKIVSARKVPVHGSSYLLTMQHQPAESDGTPEAMQAVEDAEGFYNSNTYAMFEKKASDAARSVREIIETERQAGRPVMGYGAAAKGNTFLNFAKLKLDCVIDDNPLKVGLLTPGSDIPVRDSSYLASVEEPVTILVLAWNFYNEIVGRISAVRPLQADRFVRYFPEVAICEKE